ncbi:hypothetical protein EDB87DRAFT_1685297 [Lactarius vividus]|nr:hypothetical protein EDB87DRAFT_1685297 [Lactarius vividus]
MEARGRPPSLPLSLSDNCVFSSHEQTSPMGCSQELLIELPPCPELVRLRLLIGRPSGHPIQHFFKKCLHLLVSLDNYSALFIRWSLQYDFTLFDVTPGVALSASTSQALFTLLYVSKDEVNAGVDDIVSRPLAFVDTLRRVGAFGFAAAFPFGTWMFVETSVAARRVEVETLGTSGGGGVDISALGTCA